MRMTRLVGWTLALAALVVGARVAVAQQGDVTSEQVVSALEGAYGVHPGERRNHTKGTCALGTFVGAPEAAEYSRKAGTLKISSAMPQKGAGCEEINYDPLVMGDGIAATNDPVLLFRSPSYGLSASKRLQGQ